MKEKEIVLKLAMALKGVLEDKENDNYIPIEDVDPTLFFYCLGTLMPNVIYNELAEDPVKSTEFNHIQQQLILKYALKRQRDKLENKL